MNIGYQPSEILNMNSYFFENFSFDLRIGLTKKWKNL